MLLIFSTTIPVFGTLPMEQQPTLTYDSMRCYSDSEIDLLIDEIAKAAHEAIEQAAGEAARAAFLQSMEREAAALYEAQKWRMEVQRNLQTANEAQKAKIKSVLITGLICFFGGLAVGIILR
jgi:hypothetical protein